MTKYIMLQFTLFFILLFSQSLWSQDSVKVTVETLLFGTTETFTDAIAMDRAGNLLICDALGSSNLSNPQGTTIKKITPDLQISTYAAGMNVPIGNALDSHGNLYVANWFGAVNKIAPDGTVSVFNSTSRTSDVAVDSANNVYVSRAGYNQILKIAPDGTASTFYSGSPLTSVIGLTIDDEQNLYAANWREGNIHKISINNPSTTTLIAQMPFTSPNGSIGFIEYRDGYIYCSGYATCRLYRVNVETGEVIILAGTGVAGQVDGPGTTAQFYNPNGVKLSVTGDTLFVTDDVDKSLRILIINKVTDIEDNNDVPDEFSLLQNYPNPFNPSTTISFSLDKPANIHLIIYSADGTEIASLVNGYQTEGKHSVVWNGTDANGIEVSSGIYFYTLKTDKKAVTKKMLLLR